MNWKTFEEKSLPRLGKKATCKHFITWLYLTDSKTKSHRTNGAQQLSRCRLEQDTPIAFPLCCLVGHILKTITGQSWQFSSSVEVRHCCQPVKVQMSTYPSSDTAAFNLSFLFVLLSVMQHPNYSFPHNAVTHHILPIFSHKSHSSWSSSSPLSLSHWSLWLICPASSSDCTPNSNPPFTRYFSFQQALTIWSHCVPLIRLCW